jgi:adenylyltransferase/sulfurtransferase
LAAAGVGTLGLVDGDVVAINGLHRQILHTSRDVGRMKTESASGHLQELNPYVQVRSIPERFHAGNARALISAYDVVLDTTNAVGSWYSANDACVSIGRPLVHGGLVGFNGHVLTVLPKQSACVRCALPHLLQQGRVPGDQAPAMLGAGAGVIGSLMAHEALKLIVGMGESITNRVLLWDGARGRVHEMAIQRDAACAVCGAHEITRAPSRGEPRDSAQPEGARAWPASK